MKERIFPNFLQAFFWAGVFPILFGLIVYVLVALTYAILGVFDSFYSDIYRLGPNFGFVFLFPTLFVFSKKCKTERFFDKKTTFNMHTFTFILPIVLIELHLVISYASFCNVLFDKSLSFFNGISLLKFIGICLITPIIEEVVYRKIILGQFLKQYSIFSSFLLSSLIFSLQHEQIFDYPQLFISYFIAGIIYGIIYYKTKLIIYPIIAHSLFNLTANFPIFKIIDNIARIQFIEFLISIYNLFLVLLLIFVLIILLWKLEKVKTPSE